jgi:hypothetical protein
MSKQPRIPAKSERGAQVALMVTTAVKVVAWPAAAIAEPILHNALRLAQTGGTTWTE